MTLSKQTNTKLTLVLAGVMCPRTEEPFGQEALTFTNDRILQRDVLIDVESVDRNGK